MAETRRREVIRLAEFAGRGSLIEGVEFDDCELLGPAVLALLEDVTIDGVSFDAPPEMLFIEVPADRYVVGVIGLRGVTILNCRMRNVGFIGTADSMAQFKQALKS